MSRDLDAFLAERVMGWTRWETWHDHGRTRPLTCWIRPDRQHPSPDLPAFSKDPAACALLKTRLRKLGIRFGVHHLPKDGDGVGDSFIVGRLAPRGFGLEGALRIEDGKCASMAATEERAVALFAKALVEAGAIPEAKA